MKLTTINLLLVALIFGLSSSITDCEEEENGVGEWQILSKHNFSSQIQLHPHILLIVTVPWSGESRSLMKELSRLVTDRQDEFSSLKLMIVYRNTDKLLAGAIGADGEGVTIVYYHHSVAYKYRGKLHARNILYSVNPYLSVSPDELPLKELNSPEELKDFTESTDKALILFEFCGWTRKLLAKGKNNGTDNGINLQGNHFGLGFDKGKDRGQVSGRQDHKKENGEMKCGIESGFSGIPWIDQFNLVNANDIHETEKAATGIGLSCNFEELERFELFFSKFVNAAREFFLPPERHSFGLVSNRSLLQDLGVEDSESWLAMLKFAGCPSCSKILKEGNDLKSVLQMDNGIVSELDVDGQDLDTVLPAKKPSILLFVDRSSSSSETRRKSKETLDNFRVLAQQYLIPHQIGQETKDHPGRPSVQANQVLSTSGHPRLKLSPRAQKLKFHDKMSIMVLDEGKHISLDSIATDSQGNSLQEILEYLLQKRKGAKLSSVAKEVGFRLLSDDIDIKIADEPSTSQTEFQPNQVSTTPSEEGLITVNVDLDKDQSPHGASIPAVERKEISKSSDMSSHHDDEQKVSVDTKEQYQKVSVDTKEQLIPEASDQYYLGHDLTTAKDVKVGEKSSSQISMSGDPQLEFQGFRGSFFFNDGNYRLLGALTGGSTIPSLAIVDPISNQHYVASKEATFNYSSMADFLHGFLNGTLLPYQRSESILQISREATHPPFVNMDFHEVDSIPRVTVHSFSDLVGLNQSDNENAFSAWNEDVVVLFSSSWCGFCQRMELVVREVFRAVKGYMKSLKNGYKNGQRDLNGEYLKNINFKLPRIYLMDCTLNDCSLILKSMTQREVYPALVLFPAERKNAISFKGDISVADVIKFIADHGNNSHDLLNENGIIWTLPEKGGRYQNLFEDPSPTIGNKEASVTEEGLHEVILKSETSKAAERDSWTKSHTSKSLHETAHGVVAGSILIATDKLLGVHPFENSKILIVKADQSVGFQGLIFNKHIGWDSLQELEKGLDFLKEAPLSFGGPLIKHRMPLVSLTRRVTKSQYPEIVPGVYFLDQSATVNEIEELKSGNHSIVDYWFFLGFSGWGWDQLFHEIAQGAWTTGEDRMGHLDWPSD